MPVNYPLGMIREVLAAICLFATHALNAEIYRWVDAEGRIHFSDRQPMDATTQVHKPDPHQSTPHNPDAPKTRNDNPSLGPYDAFEILAPSAGALVVQPTDALAITLILEPPLLDRQRLELLLDGRPEPVEQGSTRLPMEGVGFGSHRLQAHILDELGAIVAATPVHEVELRQSITFGRLP